MATASLRGAIAAGVSVFIVLAAATVLSAVLVTKQHNDNEDQRVAEEAAAARAAITSQADDRLASSMFAMSTYLTRYPVFAHSFSERNRTHPMSQSTINRAVAEFSLVGGTTNKLARFSLLAYVPEAERDEWESAAGTPIIKGMGVTVGGVVGAPYPRGEVSFYLPYLLAVPAAPALYGHDFVHLLQEWVDVFNETLETGTPAILSPRVNVVYGVPMFQRVPTSNPSDRPADGVFTGHLAASALAEFLGNTASNSVTGAMYDVTDATGEPIPIVPPPPVTSPLVHLASADFAVGSRTWRFSFTTTQAVMDRLTLVERSDADIEVVWIVGIAATVALALGAFGIVQLWHSRRRAFMLSVASTVANSTHERLISVINHELRGPLTVIKCGTELLKEDMEEEGDAATAALLGNVSHASRVIEKVLNNVLAVADMQRALPPPESLSVRSWLRDVGNEVRAVLSVGLDMSITVGASVPDRLMTHGQLLRKCSVTLAKKVVATVRDSPKPETHVCMHVMCPTPETVAVVVGRFRRRNRQASSLFGAKTYVHRDMLAQLARLGVTTAQLGVHNAGGTIAVNVDVWSDLPTDNGRRLTLQSFRRAPSSESSASSNNLEDLGVELRQVIQLAAVLGGVAGVVEQTSNYANLFVVIPAHADGAHGGATQDSAAPQVVADASSAPANGAKRGLFRWRSSVVDEHDVAAAPQRGARGNNGGFSVVHSATSDDTTPAHVDVAQVQVDVGAAKPTLGASDTTLSASTFFVGQPLEAHESSLGDTTPVGAAKADSRVADNDKDAANGGPATGADHADEPDAVAQPEAAVPAPASAVEPAVALGPTAATRPAAAGVVAQSPGTSRSRRQRRRAARESKPVSAEFALEDVVAVDDERVIVKMVARQLKRLGVQRIHTLNDGVHLRGYLESCDDVPTCILLDITMPQSDGVSVCRDLRADDRFADVPLFAMTANVEGKAAYELAGFTGLLGKPFSKASLSAVLTHSRKVRIARQQAAVTGVHPPSEFVVFGASR